MVHLEVGPAWEKKEMIKAVGKGQHAVRMREAKMIAGLGAASREPGEAKGIGPGARAHAGEEGKARPAGLGLVWQLLGPHLAPIWA